MALSGIEQLLGSRDTSRQVKTGVRTKTRRFFVPTISEVDAERADNIPRDASETFPGEPDLKLITVTSTLTGSGTGRYVDCYYSNQPGGGGGTRQPPPTEDLVSKKDWGRGAVMVVVEAPLNIRSKYSKPSGTPGGDTSTYVWTLGKLKFEQRRVIRFLDVFVEIRTDADMARFDAIDNQANHLHKIRGSYYRYTPPLNAVTKISDTIQKVRHVWEEDVGTPMPIIRNVGTTPAPDGRFKILLNPGGSQPGVLRDPYTYLTATPPDNPETDYFETASIAEYPIDDDGWRTLPGVPDLG